MSRKIAIRARRRPAQVQHLGSHGRIPNTSVPRRQLLIGGSAALAAFASPFAWAQGAWPGKPIRMIVPYTPGGFTDNMARAVGEPLARVLGQPVLFDYKPGANSLIGVDMLAKAPADGYTLATVIAAHSANPSLYPKMPFEAQTDVVPVALTGVAPLILVANASFPPNNMTELVAYVKARPGQLNFGSSGKGAAAHLAMEAFMAQHGLKMQHVPYKGTQPALTDLIGGQIQLLFDVPLAMSPQVKAGKIKSLGIASEKRLPGYPELNTLAEGGVPFIANTWSMILAPARTPREIIERLNVESNKILASAAVREKLESTGVLPGSGSADDAAAFLAAEIARNAKVIKDAGVTIDN
jgi:tripartite-type tricarboxylate transporter receptor subunit TctC